jgi:monothiol glutaredoxin
MRDELKQQIDSLINNNAVVLFMKGTKDRPQCGFSKQVVGVLNNIISDFVTVDVLSDPHLRDGIKVYSSWPTIPQLYINREFVGGCDIVLDLYKKNELHKLLGIEKANVKPNIIVTPAALTAFKNAQGAEDGECIRITIGQDFEHGLGFDQKGSDDFTFDFDGLPIVMDPYSAARAEGLSIDYIQEDLDAGFAFENPNEPPMVEELSVHDLKAWSDQGKNFLLIDVRPKTEWDIAHIDFAKPLFAMSTDELLALKKDQVIVFQCHHGNRSKRMGDTWRAKGFTKLYNLSGGIDAWSRQIDRTVPVY